MASKVTPGKSKGGQNPNNESDKRPPAPQGSMPKDPACPSCGLAWRLHMGPISTCEKLLEREAELETLRTENERMREDIECYEGMREGFSIRIQEAESKLAAAEKRVEELENLLTPCRPDSDTQTSYDYPCTVNDILSLLSCYWSDFIEDTEFVPDDAYFAAWERQARPVIEKALALTPKGGEA